MSTIPQQVVLGGDIILAAQGLDILTIEDLIRAARAMILSGSEGSSAPR
jgi:hypothetical protein